MQWSHSRVEAFEKCPFKFKMRYLDGIDTNDPTESNNALVLGTALHTGRLSEPYRCAGRTRNRLTTSYLTITAAHAFFNARLRQCPNSDSLLTALFAASAVVHIHIATATLPVKHFHRAPPATPEVLATHHQLHSKPDDSPTTLFLSTHCQHYRSPDDHRKKPVRRNLANRHAGR